MKSSQDVVRRWRREQQQHSSTANDSGSSPSTGTTFAVQGWNSQIAHVPTKIPVPPENVPAKHGLQKIDVILPV